MIVGIGIDLIELHRIRKSLERFADSFLEKILHPSEFAFLPSNDTPAAQSAIVTYAASRFAVKEAAVKALGTGFAEGIKPGDIAVVPLASGQPSLVFYNKAKERADFLGVTSMHISLTHSKETAGAVVILEK